jgi:hypothetical protein
MFSERFVAVTMTSSISCAATPPVAEASKAAETDCATSVLLKVTDSLDGLFTVSP